MLGRFRRKDKKKLEQTSSKNNNNPKPLKSNDIIKVRSWNVNGCNQEKEELINNHPADISCLCETHAKGCPRIDTNKISSGNLVIDDKAAGCMVILSDKAAKALCDAVVYSNRIIIIRFKTKTGHMTVINCYIPYYNHKKVEA